MLCGFKDENLPFSKPVQMAINPKKSIQYKNTIQGKYANLSDIFFIIIPIFPTKWPQVCMGINMWEYKNKSIYRKSKLLGGYALMILDDAGYKIKWVHLHEEALQSYLKIFGEKIIKESLFLDWWCDNYNSKAC
jgi:hypothetical protein